MNKKIITIAEIVFALVFVVLLSVFMATINSKGTTANNQLVDTLEMTSGTSIDKYIQMSGDKDFGTAKAKGTEVSNLASNYKTIGGDVKIQIDVITNNEGTTKSYGYRTQSGNYPKPGTGTNYELGEDMGGYTAPISTAEDYINPAGDFVVKAVKNANGINDYLVFKQV